MSQTVAFFDRTYDEALCLTCEARDYIAGASSDERRGLAPEIRLAASCEEMRLTARMTQIMAWLLMRRAVHEGEVTPGEAAAQEHRLSGQSACLAEALVPESDLPPRLVDLLTRSRNLYLRVQRLDAALGEATAGQI